LFADAANAVMLITGLLVITQKNKTMYLCGYERERESTALSTNSAKKTSEEIKKTVKKLFIFFTVLKTVKKSFKKVKKLFIFFTVFYFLHRFQLCSIFIYFFSLFFSVKKAFQKTKHFFYSDTRERERERKERERDRER
jgi:hypothetical protein